MEIKKTEKVVENILINNEEARKDDFLLIYLVFQNFIGAKVDTKTFDEIMLNHKEYGLPSFHTISRVRRKIFEKQPNLRPEKITEIRKELEEEYKEYGKQ